MTSSLESIIKQFKSTYPNFDEDYESDLLKQELTLQIIQMRLDSGLNQSKFAEKIGLKQSHLSRLEKGLSNPTITSLSKIARKAGYQLEFTFNHKQKDH